MKPQNVIPFPDGDRIQEEAAEWLIRLDRGELPDEDCHRLREWLQASPSHRRALERLARVWDGLDSLAVLERLFPNPQPSRYAKKARHGARREQPVAIALASLLGLGGLIASLLVMGPGLLHLTAGDEPTELVYRTETGQQSEVFLKDGSTLTLNTRSEVRVRFDDNRRAVYMAAGEAFFDVASNPDLPFVVFAGDGQVRALGTAFNVRIQEEKVDVVVAEGTVEISKPPKGSEEPHSGTLEEPTTAVVLTEGGTARYHQSIESLDYLAPESLNQKLAWKRGKWAFQGESLEQVINEVSRYTDTHIKIVDERIAELRIGGYFDISDIDLFLEALEAGFGVRHVRMSGDVIYLSANDAP